MYYIITNEPEDKLVMKAVNKLIGKKQTNISVSNGDYIFITQGTAKKGGDGGKKANQLVIIGHANENGISGYKTFKSYWEDVLKSNVEIKIDNSTKVYLIACSTAKESEIKFLYKNIASEFKKFLNVSTLWASYSTVNIDFEGTWTKV